MNEKQKLLRQASKEFTAKNVKCICYSASRVIAENGFSYVLVDRKENKVINNITIHFNKNREMYPTGQMDLGEVVIQTPVSLSDTFKTSPELFILKLSDSDDYFMVYSLIGYNKEMSQFDYRGEILQNKNKDFIVYDITNIKDNLINNSMPLWLLNSERLGLPIYPAYLSPLNLETKYLSVDITDTRALTIAELDNKSIGQWKEDNIRLYLMNATTEEQQDLAYKIQTLAMEHIDNIFGVNSTVGFKSVFDDRQRGFGIVSNKAISDIVINYYQSTQSSDLSIELIKKIIVKVNNETITLFNLEELK